MEDKIKAELRQYLTRRGYLDERMPVCPDVEDKWQSIAQDYLPDGVREFNGYPTVSLGWMMFIGMAVAKFWDEDWERYIAMESLYESVRDKRGFDNMDDYILEEVLSLGDEEKRQVSGMVSECAARTYNILRHEPLEPGTPEAFKAYVVCLRLLYNTGMAVQLNRMDYHMTKVD